MKTREIGVIKGTALVNSYMPMVAEMLYNATTGQFKRKMTQIQVWHAQTGKMIGECDFDLAEYACSSEISQV